MSINYNKRPGEKEDTKQHENQKIINLSDVYDSSVVADGEHPQSMSVTSSATPASGESKEMSVTPSSTDPVNGAQHQSDGNQTSTSSQNSNGLDNDHEDDDGVDEDAKHETYESPKVIRLKSRGTQPSGTMAEGSDHPGMDANYEDVAENAVNPILNQRGKDAAQRTQDDIDKQVINAKTNQFNNHRERVRAEFRMRDYLVNQYYTSMIKRAQGKKAKAEALKNARKYAWEDINKYEETHDLKQEGRLDKKGNPQINALMTVVWPNLDQAHKERVAEWRASQKQGHGTDDSKPESGDQGDDRNLSPDDKLKRARHWAVQAAAAGNDQEHNQFAYRATQMFLEAKFPGQHQQAENFMDMMVSQTKAGGPSATEADKMAAFADKINSHFDGLNGQADEYIKTMMSDPADDMTKEDEAVQQELFNTHERVEEANDSSTDPHKKNQRRYRNDQHSEQDDDAKNGVGDGDHEETRQDIKRWQKLMSKDHGVIKADPYHEYKGKLRVYLPRDLDMVAYGETMRRLGQKPDANDLKFDKKKDQPYAMMDPNQYYTYAQVQREQQNQIDQQRIEQAQKLDEKNQEKARQATDPNSKMSKDKRQAMLESLPTSALVFELGRRAGHGMVASTASGVGKVAQGLQMWAQRAAMSMRKHDSAVSPAVSIIGDGTFNREQQKYAGPER